MFQPPTHTGVDDVHAHPRHVGHRSLDLILALTAVFISAVSLYVAIDHGRTERKLVRANAQLVQAASWPFLQVDGSYSDTRTLQITLVNAGVGPAKLQSVVVLFDGQPVDTLSSLLERCCDLPSGGAERKALLPDGLPTSTIDNEVVRPGESNTVMTIPATPENHVLGQRFAAAASRITFRACYCSVFDACWTSDLRSLTPQPVARCPVEPSFNESLQRPVSDPRAAAADGGTPPAPPSRSAPPPPP